jgi:hypothetical protein
MKTITTVAAATLISFISVSFSFAQYGGGGGGGGGNGGPVGSYLVFGQSNDAFVVAQKAVPALAGVGTGSGSAAGGVKCPVYMTKFNRTGLTSSEYAKLVSFLNKYDGASVTSSTFNSSTAAAVKKFQAKYGISPVSGHQLTKTTKKINELYCKFAGF